MRIRGWSIESFGHFRDYVVEDLPDGLVVFRGPNEAGKTTLLAFLRGVLFGFAGPGADHYPALRGGRYGGRIFLVADDGEYAVERNGRSDGARIVLPDGTQGTNADLQSLLAGVDDSLFRGVFAFGLPELQAFDTLDGDALRDRLFSASLAGAGRSATAVIDQLGRSASRLLGDEGRIDALVESLNRLAPRREAARRAALGYADQVAEERRIAGEISDARRRVAELQAVKRRSELLLDLWPQWNGLGEIRAEHAGLEPVAPLPEGFGEHLRAVNERLAAARAVLSALEEEQREAARQRDARGAPRASESGPRIERLHQDSALQRDRLERLPALRARRGEADLALRRSLASLGAGWGLERLARCDVSPAARERLRALESAWRENTAEEERRSAEVVLAAAPREALVEERLGLAAEIEAMADQTRRIEEERDTLARLRTNLGELAKERTRGEVMDRKVQDREVAMRSSEAEVLPEPPAWLPPILWAIVPLAVLAMPWRALHADLAGVAAFALTAFVAAVGAWASSYLRRWRSERERRREVESRALRNELHEARRMRDTHWRRAAEGLETVARDAVRLSLPRLPTLAQLDEHNQELDRRTEEAAETETAQARLAEIDADLERIAAEVALLEQRVAQSADARRRWQREWAAWKAERFLPETLAVEQARELLDVVQQAQAPAREIAGMDAEIAELDRDAGAWESAAGALLDSEGAPGGAERGAALIERIADLYRTHLDNEARRLVALRLERELEERARRIGEARADVARHDTERDALLASVGVADEAELERRRALAARRQALEQAIAERAQALEARIVHEPEADAFRASLSAADPPGWERRVTEAEHEIRATEQRLLDAAARHRDAERQRQELEQSSELARLDLEWNGLTDELGAAVRRWRVLAAARALMEETLEQFRSARQPPVLAEASRSFALVTDGRYRRIEQGEDGRELIALEVKGDRKRVPEGLSRGTAEQLYLCLRLGLVADFANRGTALPVVMDDVLVNFDPGRAGAMAMALGDFAEKRQLLFFTCHPHVSSMLEQLGRASAVIQL